MGEWSRVDWLLDVHGISDSALYGFDVDGRWRLLCEYPTFGSLGVAPMRKNGRRAVLSDAVWLAACIGYDHDLPVGVSPSRYNTKAKFPYEPIVPMSVLPGDDTPWYFQNLNGAFAAAAELRFGGDTIVLRYRQEDGPGTEFSSRFAGREGMVNLYAMATRQADVLSEYLCLYRILEADDSMNGKTSAAARLPDLPRHPFGEFYVYQQGFGMAEKYIDVFGAYRERALTEIRRIRRRGEDVPTRLYEIRNSLAHGKTATRTSDFGPTLSEVSKALPIVKLLARMAVEPE
jgi:hypothetical protein